jgi:transposase InsO family protein
MGESVARIAEYQNHVWTYGFVFAWILGGRPLNFLTLEDEYTRESLAIEVGRTFQALEVRAVPARVIGERGMPKFIRSDNGPAFIAMEIRLWQKDKGLASI